MQLTIRSLFRMLTVGVALAGLLLTAAIAWANAIGTGGAFNACVSNTTGDVRL